MKKIYVTNEHKGYFHCLESYVTPEEERRIRKKRDLLKKIYF